MTLTFDSFMTLTLDFSRSNFETALTQEFVGLIDVKWKGHKSVGYWADCMTLTFEHITAFRLAFSR